MLEGIADLAPGPDARYETKESVALSSACSTSRRASDRCSYYATLESRMPLGAGARERAPLPGSAVQRQLLGQFAQAFEDGDAERIVALLTDEALLTMPPEPLEYQGKEAIAAFLHDRFAPVVDRPTRLVPTRANGQPAFGYYIGDAHTPILRFTSVFVLTLEGDRIAGLTRFGDTGILPAFGLPRVLR